MKDLSGQKIDKYTLVKLIGRGAFGQVYQAIEDGQVGFCALKLLIPDPDKPYPLLRDFVLEIRTIFRLTHPNIVQLRDFGTVDLADYPESLAFFVMDYCKNGTLRKQHQQHQHLSLSIVVPYVKQIAAALQHVHDQNIVHRDVKPENLLIGDHDEVLLSDFGIATRTFTRNAIDQFPAGTLNYMAPEQFEGKARRASDQYGLGIVVYEWLSGTLPFTGSTEYILHQHKYVRPPSLQGRIADISEEVEEVVMRTLEKDPQKRYPKILDFSEALESAAMITEPAWQGPSQLIFTAHKEGVSAVASSPQGHIMASGSINGTVLVWGAMTLQQRFRCNKHVGAVKIISWSPDGKQFATADENGTVFIWNALNGDLVRQWQAHESVRSLAWHPHKPRLISAGNDATVRFWNATTGALMNTYSTYAKMVDAVAWSPDGGSFACSCDDASVRVLEEATLHYRSLYRQHTARVTSIAWLPVGARQYVASAGYDCSIQIWDVITQELFSTFKGHSDAVLALAWSPNGHYLASCSSDSSVRIWEVATGACVQQYAHDKEVSGVSWSPDGRYFASSSWDGTVQIHALDARL
jgi:eukaryotic-like serine/threonine-protein kinase